MGGMFGGGGSPAPAPPPLPPPTQDDPSVQAKIDEEKRRLAAAHGRASTVLTTGEGDTSTPEIKKKSLLGE